MGYFGQEGDIKIWETVDEIDALDINDTNVRKQAIYDIIEKFGKWLHIRTCDSMIDPD